MLKREHQWEDKRSAKELAQAWRVFQPATNIQRHNYVASEKLALPKPHNLMVYFNTVAKGKSHIKAKAKLESFARQYVINHFNGQQAAIAAGFAPKSARITAAKLLAKANVQERIASLLAAANKKLDYSIEKTLQQIARHAFADPRVLFNSDGSMKKITELDEDAAAMIGGVELSGKRVKRVKITDALRALDMLARSHKLYAEDRNPVDTGVKVIIMDMPRPARPVAKAVNPQLPSPETRSDHAIQEAHRSSSRSSFRT